MEIDLNELESAASNALNGRYFVADPCTGERGWEVVAQSGMTRVAADMREEQARYFALLSPVIVLELIRRVRLAEKALVLNAGPDRPVVIRSSKEPNSLEIFEAMSGLRNYLPKGTSVIFIGPDTSIEALAPEQMRKAGWVRADESGVIRSSDITLTVGGVELPLGPAVVEERCAECGFDVSMGPPFHADCPSRKKQGDPS